MATAQAQARRRVSDNAAARKRWKAGDLAHSVAEAPVPAAAAWEAPPLEAGEHILEGAFRRFLGRLEASDRARIATWAATELRSRLVLSTACSGTELPVMACAAFARVISVDLGSPLQVDAGFACEIDAKKQAWLKMCFPGMDWLFRDAKLLGKDSCHDEITHTSRPVASCDTLIAGFPCTDASRLNRAAHSLQNLTCVMSADMRTGSVYNGLMGYIDNHGSSTQSLVLENVASLATPAKTVGKIAAPSNLQACVCLLNLRGYHAKPFKLCPTLFEIPQQRKRLYIPALRMQTLEKAGRLPPAVLVYLPFA